MLGSGRGSRGAGSSKVLERGGSVITYVKGSLFESPAQVLVNTVNTEGVMGKGVALRFKQIYPEMFREYQELCEQGKLKIGTLHIYRGGRRNWVVNFPTKVHWRHPSKVEYLEKGLATFVRVYAEAGIHSVAFPPLGCGNGQLDFATQVQPLMEKYLRPLPIDVFIYPPLPAGAPEQADPKGFAEWLRSEPESLPFEEVWRDLVELLDESAEFETATGTPFKARAEENPPTLTVEASKSYVIGQEDLLEFWQQLRQHGFSHRHITPERVKPSYLLPVFARLPYVQPVQVSDTASGLGKQPTYALQVRPRARASKGQSEPVQASLLNAQEARREGDRGVPRIRQKATQGHTA